MPGILLVTLLFYNILLRPVSVLGRRQAFHNDTEYFYATKAALLSATAVFQQNLKSETDEEVAAIMLRSYKQRAFRDGDVILGVLLPIHRPASASSYPVRCSVIWEEYGMHRMEQLIWTIEKINKEQKIPGVTLGYDIRDTCWTTQVALERTMDFIKSKAGDDYCVRPDGKKMTLKSPLAAILGAASSEISVAVQEVAQMFDIPQVDFGSTSPQLSDKSVFRLFARVIPSDLDQARMLVDIIRHFGWQYVHGVYTEGNYGEKGYEAFRDVLNNEATVCLATSRKFLLRVPDTHEQYVTLISDLAKHPDTRVIVCFCDGLGVRALFRTLTKHNLNGSYVIVGSDGWNVRKDIIRGFESAASGGLSVTHWSPRLKGFEERFYSLNPHTVSHERNPWFAEYWAQKHGCIMSGSALLGLSASPFNRKVTRSIGMSTTPYFRNRTVRYPRKRKLCTGNEVTRERLKQEAKLGFVTNSVYAVAYAIRYVLERHCYNKTIRTCEHLHPFVNGTLLFESLKEVEFRSYANELVRFDSNMDGVGKYQLWNFQAIPGRRRRYRYMPIGEWEKHRRLFINNSLLVWPSNITYKMPGTNVPAAFCSKTCSYNQIKVVPNVALPCCWDCLLCPAGAYVSNGTKCVSCKPGWAPNAMLTDCEKVKIRFRNLSEIESVVTVTIASVGMIAVLGVWFAYYFTRRLSVPRAFSLVGILATFTTVFSLLSRPTLLTCYFSRILPPIAQAILFSPIFNRANAMVRIVDSSRKLIIDRRPRFISTNSQIALTCFIIGAQCTVVVMMLIWEAADVKIVYPSYNVALLVCRSTFPVTAIPLAFNGILMFATMVYSLRTRKIKQMIRSDESLYYPMVMGTNALVTFSSVLFFYAIGTEDHLVISAHQLVAGFSTMVMFVLPLFSGPEQLELEEATFAESVRNNFHPHNSFNAGRRKSVSTRLWDTMTIMREVAANTKTGQAGVLGDVNLDGMSSFSRAMRKASTGEKSNEDSQSEGGSSIARKRRFFRFSHTNDVASQAGSVGSADKKDKERERQEKYKEIRARNAFVLVTAPSDISAPGTSSPDRPSWSRPAAKNSASSGSPPEDGEEEEEEEEEDEMEEEEEEEEELQVSIIEEAGEADNKDPPKPIQVDLDRSGSAHVSLAKPLENRSPELIRSFKKSDLIPLVKGPKPPPLPPPPIPSKAQTAYMGIDDDSLNGADQIYARLGTNVTRRNRVRRSIPEGAKCTATGDLTLMSTLLADTNPTKRMRSPEPIGESVWSPLLPQDQSAKRQTPKPQSSHSHNLLSHHESDPPVYGALERPPSRAGETHRRGRSRKE